MREYRVEWRADAIRFYVPDLARGQRPLWTTPLTGSTLSAMHLLFNYYEPGWKGGSGPLTSPMRVESVRVSAD